MTAIVWNDETKADYRRLLQKERRSARRKEQRAVNGQGESKLAGLTRMVENLPDSVGAGDIALADLVALRDLISVQLDAAVIRLVGTEGWSWAMVGDALGTTRQAALKRWGDRVTSTRPSGGQPSPLR